MGISWRFHEDFMGFQGIHGDFMGISWDFMRISWDFKEFMEMSWDLMKIYEEIGILARDIMGSCRLIGYNLQYETWEPT